ncbi:hypothetical protein T4C_11152 [Trichinella pseudospiralis]|uniref:Uncharacterized protein n=1 Tax=Trichinella pseudospiralis TaxID=6337 RepID=A0A0V1KFA9_TRIPS|nr:hypothetical protein T4C_11152 [Trichinella pseudospiralis]
MVKLDLCQTHTIKRLSQITALAQTTHLLVTNSDTAEKIAKNSSSKQTASCYSSPTSEIAKVVDIDPLGSMGLSKRSIKA